MCLLRFALGLSFILTLFIGRLYLTVKEGRLDPYVTSSETTGSPSETFGCSSAAPVAVFIGGTSGIGQGMAEVFARDTKGNSHIVIVGRNEAAAERLFTFMPGSPGSTREFVRCDATLMKNVQKATQTILARHAKINYLVMSPGIVTLAGRDETTEGIDKKLAVHYYARWKFLHDLLPALEKAKVDGEAAVAMSVLAAGKGGAIYSDDLALKKGFSVSRAALITPTYTDMMMEAFAEMSPRITFIHTYPGFVRTGIMTSSPSWMISRAYSLLLPLLRPFTVSPQECGEYMWKAINHTATKPGAWRVGAKGEDINKSRYFGGEEERKIIWEHTVDVMKAAVGTDPADSK